MIRWFVELSWLVNWFVNSLSLCCRRGHGRSEGLRSWTRCTYWTCSRTSRTRSRPRRWSARNSAVRRPCRSLRRSKGPLRFWYYSYCFLFSHLTLVLFTLSSHSYCLLFYHLTHTLFSFIISLILCLVFECFFLSLTSYSTYLMLWYIQDTCLCHLDNKWLFGWERWRKMGGGE